MLWIVLFSSIIGAVLVFFFLFIELFRRDTNTADVRDLVKLLIICTIFFIFSYGGIKKIEEGYYTSSLIILHYHLYSLYLYESDNAYIADFSNGSNWRHVSFYKDGLTVMHNDCFKPTYIVRLNELKHTMNRHLLLILTLENRNEIEYHRVFFLPNFHIEF